MYFRYIFGKSQRIEKDGKIIYSYKDGDKVDEYVTDLLWTKNHQTLKNDRKTRTLEKLLRIH